MKRFEILLLSVLFMGSMIAQNKLPALFSDNMALQQGFEAPFWG